MTNYCFYPIDSHKKIPEHGSLYLHGRYNLYNILCLIEKFY